MSWKRAHLSAWIVDGVSRGYRITGLVEVRQWVKEELKATLLLRGTTSQRSDASFHRNSYSSQRETFDESTSAPVPLVWVHAKPRICTEERVAVQRSQRWKERRSLFKTVSRRKVTEHGWNEALLEQWSSLLEIRKRRGCVAARIGCGYNINRRRFEKRLLPPSSIRLISADWSHGTAKQERKRVAVLKIASTRFYVSYIWSISLSAWDVISVRRSMTTWTTCGDDQMRMKRERERGVKTS